MLKSKWSQWTIALFLMGYMGLIFYLSSIPGTEIRVEAPDYLLHGLAFGGLSFLTTLYFIHFLPLKWSMSLSLGFTFLYGLSDEAHQFFVPNRTPDWRDIGADLIGALIVQVGFFILIRLYSYVKLQVKSDQ